LGNDLLKGHLGRDLLIGGAGKDSLSGQDDDDILIGGSTVHDLDINALSALMSEWTRTDLSAVSRIAHLQTGGVGANNGMTLLDALSLLDDGVVDSLNGGPGSNWLL
jgi:Ca2+-binding RTX toxin-like protein